MKGSEGKRKLCANTHKNVNSRQSRHSWGLTGWLEAGRDGGKTEVEKGDEGEKEAGRVRGN